VKPAQGPRRAHQQLGSRQEALIRAIQYFTGLSSLEPSLRSKAPSSRGVTRGYHEAGEISHQDLLGDTPAEIPERYDAASPALLPLGIPQVLLHRTTGDIAPFEIMESYVRKAQALGADATIARIGFTSQALPRPLSQARLKVTCPAHIGQEL